MTGEIDRRRIRAFFVAAALIGAMVLVQCYRSAVRAKEDARVKALLRQEVSVSYAYPRFLRFFSPAFVHANDPPVVLIGFGQQYWHVRGADPYYIYVKELRSILFTTGKMSTAIGSTRRRLPSLIPGPEGRCR